VVQGVSQLKPEKDDEDDDAPPAKTWLEHLVSRFLPITREPNPDGHFVMRLGPEQKLHATMLLVALVSVEVADVVFALDSVPAVLTVSTDPFIVFTSNVFAILGLRSLYFVIAGMMDRFGHLKYALAAILIFVGVKMGLHEVIHIPISVSLAIIVGSVLVGVATSMYASRDAAHKQA
jgi:tellurite resistance protein TerC